MSGKRPTLKARLLLLVTAAVFLLPVYGSLVDVSYPERQPSHKHIYLDRINPYHHLFTDNDDVVNLPDLDATGQSVVLLFLPDIQLVAFSAESNNLSFGLSDEYLTPEDAYLPPPDHPPRI